MLSNAAFAGGALLIGHAAALAQTPTSGRADEAFKFKDNNSERGNTPGTGPGVAPGEPGKDYTPVVVPNGWALPYTVVDGVKVFQLVAEEVDHEFAPGLRAKCWGYNGSVHGPVIEAVEGDLSTGTGSSSPAAWTASADCPKRPSSPAKLICMSLPCASTAH